MSEQQNLKDGCRVELKGIVSRPEINGCTGVVIGIFDAEKRRWPVLVTKRRGRDEEMLLKPANLVLLGETDSDDIDASDESYSSSSSDELFFKCDRTISQNMEQPYRSLSGAPLMSFFGSPVLFPPDSAPKHKVCHSTACPLRVGVPSEQLVEVFKGSKLRSCTTCRDAWYCSIDCQAHDWLDGGHRTRCAEIMSAFSKLSKAASLESDDSYEETETDPARVSKAFKTDPGQQPIQNFRGFAKLSSRLTFEEKCTLEFLYSCGMMQTIMSDTFHRRANFLPPADSNLPFKFKVDAKAKVQGDENTSLWFPLAWKFKSWMWRTCNEGSFLNFRGSIPVGFLPHVRVVVCNAIELLRSWEPQENKKWAMQRETYVMANLIAGFGHQKCFVDEILTPGAQLHCYVQLLLQWCAWRGPVTHDWSGLMQLLLSALLSGLELSETRHCSPIPSSVAVIEPICRSFVAALAGDVYRFRSYKPLHLGNTQVFDRLTASEANRIMLKLENHASLFFSEEATRELQACLRARRYFPNLDLGPLWRLATFHKHQILSTGAHRVVTHLLDHVAIYEKVLAFAKLSYSCLPLPPLFTSALLLIDLPSSLTPTIVSAIPLLLFRLKLQSGAFGVPSNP
jgi:hypothetical protein